MMIPALASNILETIGNTPMVRINRVLPPGMSSSVEILAKLEWFNPAGSVKERIGISMIEAAESDGRLTKNKTVLESTSGNTGIGLAMACAVKGYSLLITMSEGASIERRQILKALGAEIVLTPKEMGGDGSWARADEIAEAEPERYCRLQQYSEPSNAETHYRTTANEIWQQTSGSLDVFVAGLGTTGTIMGTSRRLRELNPAIRIVGVEPQPKGKQAGIRNLNVTRVPPLFDATVLDERIVIEDPEAFELARRLAREEGMFGGISCGSALAGAWRVATTMKQGRIVVVFPDHGYKYLSTDLYPAD